MKPLILTVSVLALIGCTNHTVKTQSKTARITFYNPYEDKWGSRIAMSSKMRAKEGITVAAHSDFQFGQTVIIPDLKGVLNNTGQFIVQDRGSAVEKKVASQGQYYVFDVYLNRNGRRLKKLDAQIPDYTDVYFNK